MTSAEYIQNFRETHHLSRNMLAYYTGCSVNLVARLENGMEPSREWWESLQELNLQLEEQHEAEAQAEEMQGDMEEILELRESEMEEDEMDA